MIKKSDNFLKTVKNLVLDGWITTSCYGNAPIFGKGKERKLVNNDGFTHAYLSPLTTDEQEYYDISHILPESNISFYQK